MIMSTLPAPAQHRIEINTPGLQRVQITEAGIWNVVLTVPRAEAELVGLFEASTDEQLSVRVIIHHQAAHTRAKTTLKGVARDAASIHFLGKIIIDENCGDTNSFLTERILLLSPKARAEAIPELEILSDDVKCSHAASISSLPEDQLFYLMSRGVSRTQAEAMIVTGFLESTH